MTLWCFRRHVLPFGYDPAPRYRIGDVPQRHTPGTWLICGLAPWTTALWALLVVGILTADEDGGILYWRWRFWRPSIFRRPLFNALLHEART